MSVPTDALVAAVVHGGNGSGFSDGADAFLYGDGWQFPLALQCGLGNNLVVAS